MKLGQMVWSSLLLGGLGLSSAALALTKAQKQELYKKGTISVFDESGRKTGHFEVKFMPGKENVLADAKAQWAKAEDLMDDFLDKKEFWHDEMLDSFQKGVRHIKRAYENGIGRVDDEFRATLEENKKLQDSFGATGARLKNWVEFAAESTFLTVGTLFGAAYGALYAVCVPTAKVVYRPVAAGTAAIAAGTLWPAVKLAWNGVAWNMVKDEGEPKAGDMTVTFIPEEIPDHVVADDVHTDEVDSAETVVTDDVDSAAEAA